MSIEKQWSIASASVVGSSHIRSELPCQDNHLCQLLHDRFGDPVLVAVVSDGAGSAEKSDIGSLIACSSITEQASSFLNSGKTVSDFYESDAREWVAGVQEVIAERASSDDASMRDYACTLLVAFVGVGSCAFFQIGDGAIVVSSADEDWSWVIWPQRGEYANTTYFVTEKEAENQIEFSAGPNRIEDLAVFSDGIEPLILDYASKTAHAPFFERIVKPLRESNHSGLDLDLSKALKSYLASPRITERTDDDKTLILATRRSISLPADQDMVDASRIDQ